jgi:hypothetical protein
MERMAFDNQPYIIYRHYDAGHPHIHIVATSIRADGSKIHLQPSDLQKSIAICKELESEFSLQPNRRSTTEDLATFQVEHAHKVVYGEPDLKRSVSDVLNTVVDHYQYTSMGPKALFRGKAWATVIRWMRSGNAAGLQKGLLKKKYPRID